MACNALVGSHKRDLPACFQMLDPVDLSFETAERHTLVGTISPDGPSQLAASIRRMAPAPGSRTPAAVPANRADDTCPVDPGPAKRIRVWSGASSRLAPQVRQTDPSAASDPDIPRTAGFTHVVPEPSDRRKVAGP